MDLQNLTTAHIAIGISVLSLMVASFSLGWNVFKELGLRPRVKVTMGVMILLYEHGEEKKVRFSAVNHGPGVVHLLSIALEKRAKRGRRLFVSSLVPEFRSTAGNEHLPIKLEVGQHAEFWVPYKEGGFLKEEWRHVGIRDSFDRYHWAPRKKLKQARADYEKDFGGPLRSRDERG